MVTADVVRMICGTPDKQDTLSLVERAFVYAEIDDSSAVCAAILQDTCLPRCCLIGR